MAREDRQWERSSSADNPAVIDPDGRHCRLRQTTAAGYCRVSDEESSQAKRKLEQQRANDEKNGTGFYEVYPDGRNYDYCPDGTPTQDPSAC